MTGPFSSRRKQTKLHRDGVPRQRDEESAAEPRQREPLECPDCHARFRPEPDAVRSAMCPRCLAMVPLVRRPRPKTEAPPAAPRQWPKFFLGVFTFPLYEGVFSRWLLLSVGCIVTMLTTAMLIWFASMGWVSGVLALRMTWGWATLFTLGYASALIQPIITETAAGSEIVEDWPDPNWRDWLLDLLWMVPPTLTATVVAIVLAVPFAVLLDEFWLPFAGTLLLVFPIVLLSAFEAGSAAVPLTRTVLRSLGSHWWAWLLFYAETALLACVWPGLFLRGLPYEPVPVGIVTGPLMAGVMLIYARLLGRLGHAISLERQTNPALP